MSCQRITIAKIKAAEVSDVEYQLSVLTHEEGEARGPGIKKLIETLEGCAGEALYFQQYVDNCSDEALLERNLSEVDAQHVDGGGYRVVIVPTVHPKVLKGMLRKIERGGAERADRWLGTSMMEAFRWKKREAEGSVMLVVSEVMG